MYTITLNPNGSIIISKENDKGFIGQFSKLPENKFLYAKIRSSEGFTKFEFKYSFNKEMKNYVWEMNTIVNQRYIQNWLEAKNSQTFFDIKEFHFSE